MTEKYFINLNKKISGNLLCIGLNNKKIIDKLLSNENLTRFVLIDVNLGGTGSGSINKMMDKKIYLCDIKKTFNKKKMDYIICNSESVKNELVGFVKDSIYINSNMMYLYGNINSVDVDNLIYRYTRYGSRVNKISDGDDFILEISNERVKTPFYKNIFYVVIDYLYSLKNEIFTLIMK